MNDMKIQIESKLMPIEGSEIDKLEQLCQQNDIEFSNTLFRLDGLVHSALWSWVTIYLTPELVNAITTGVIPGVAKDLIVGAIKAAFQAIREKFLPHKSKNCDVVEIKTDTVYIKVTSDHIPEETFNKAFDVFLEAAKNPESDSSKVFFPTYVVIDNDKTIEMSQQEYIKQYLMPEKNDVEGKSDGQA